MSRTRILIADDHGIVRQGLQFVLQREADMEVVGDAEDGRQAVAFAEKLHPDVVVMDIGMPNLNGIEATTQILRHSPDTKVIILSMHEDEVYLVRALAAGVKGYLVKGSAFADLPGAVRAVVAGKCFFSPSISKLLAEEYTRQVQLKQLEDSYDLLTDREKEILQLLAEGKSNKEAATVLDISPYTVETHRNHFMQKLGLHNTAEIVLYAVRKKLLA
jgi:DNA-binding NarL/FixJ family response regulator